MVFHLGLIEPRLIGQQYRMARFMNFCVLGGAEKIIFTPHSSCVSTYYQRLFVFEVNSKLSEHIFSKITVTAVTFILAVASICLNSNTIAKCYKGQLFWCLKGKD